LSFRLSSQNDPAQTIRMNNWTWFGILDLAEKHGWNPHGTATPDRLEYAGYPPAEGGLWFGAYWEDQPRLVLIEDALNMADALEQAFIRYEPIRLPSLHPFHLASGNGDQPPGIGVVLMMIRFCQSGAFLIERI